MAVLGKYEKGQDHEYDGNFLHGMLSFCIHALSKKKPGRKISDPGISLFYPQDGSGPHCPRRAPSVFQAGLLTFGSSSSVKLPVRALNEICRAFPFLFHLEQ